jgi:hypothetical protein
MIEYVGSILPYLSLILAIATTVGGILAFRQSYRQNYTKMANEIQERVIAALKLQIETLERELVGCQHDVIRLRRVISTIRYVLKQRGMSIVVEGDYITMTDSKTSKTRTIQVRANVPEDEEKIENDEDDDSGQSKSRTRTTK